jgi:hypothetical protein
MWNIFLSAVHGPNNAVRFTTGRINPKPAEPIQTRLAEKAIGSEKPARPSPVDILFF